MQPLCEMLREAAATQRGREREREKRAAHECSRGFSKAAAAAHAPASKVPPSFFFLLLSFSLSLSRRARLQYISRPFLQCARASIRSLMYPRVLANFFYRRTGSIMCNDIHPD